MVYKMIDRIIIANQHSKGIMTRDSQQCTGDGNREPVFLCANNIEDILQCSKAKTYTDGIDNAIEMLVEIGILSQDKPQSK